MSLSFNLQNVEKHEELSDGLKQAVIFMAMFIGMGTITADNHHEFYRRAWEYEAVVGPVQGGGHYITAKDIEALIGLTTNVFPAWSKARFATELGKIALATAISTRNNLKGHAYPAV